MKYKMRKLIEILQSLDPDEILDVDTDTYHNLKFVIDKKTHGKYHYGLSESPEVSCRSCRYFAADSEGVYCRNHKIYDSFPYGHVNSDYTCDLFRKDV